MRLPVSKTMAVRILCALAAAVVVILLIGAKKPWNFQGEPERIKDFVSIYEWWAGAINAVLLLSLAGTAGFWARSGEGRFNSWLPAAKSPRWFWPLVLIAMLLTAFWGFQRLPMSVWDDEDTSLHRVVLGQYRIDEKGEPKLKEIPWQETFWNYRLPTNHHLQSILSRLSLSTWRTLVRPEGSQVSESAVRFPGYIAGVLSVAAIALLVRRVGFPRAAVAAAFLLALHPWHVRYVAEARGYIYTLLFGPLLVVALLNAIETGRWRWWIAFAATEFAILYAYPGCLYLVLAANFCGLILIFARPDMAKISQISRMAVVNMVAGMIFLQLMLPCIPQFRDYLAHERSQGELTPRWHRNMFAHILTGTPWNNSDMPKAGYPELKWVADSHEILFPVLAWLAFALLLIGIVRLLSSKPAGWVVVAVLLLPALPIYLMAKSNGTYLYEWYLIFMLPGLAAAVALGLDSIAALCGRLHRFATPFVLFAGIATFAFATEGPRHLLTSRSLQPRRESVLLVRPNLNPFDPRQKEIITAGFTAMPVAYDAFINKLRNAEDLKKLMLESDRSHRPLYVLFGNGWAAAFGVPDIMKIVDDDVYFEKTAELPGFDPTLTHYVRRYNPGSVDKLTQ